MRKIFRSGFFRTGVVAIMALCVLSCEKVINIDLHDSEPRVVIEGNIPLDSLCRVVMTRSINFSEPNIFPPISGAVITISDDSTKVVDTCPETVAGEGKYQSRTMTGIEGHTYTLTVQYGGQTYTGSSTLPVQVPLDSTSITRLSGFGRTFFQMTPYYTDPAGIRNYYKFEIRAKGLVDNSIRVRDDGFTDGQVNRIPINLSSDIVEGDTVTFTMLCIDSTAFVFYRTLGAGSSSTSPANPISNLSGGCLGYFKAYTSQSVQLVVK